MRPVWLTSTAIAAAIIIPSAALGQTQAAAAPEAVFGLEEIVVTAQRVEENLQRAALAISAVSGEDLERAGVTDVTQLTQLTPALQIGNLFGPYPAFYLRGVGNFSTNSLSDPAVAFSVDGVYFARQSSAQGVFYDLERVEVLKGPQGTLYGRNATGGAINVITAKPRLGEYSGDVTVEVGNYNSLKATGAANIPLGEANALRVAAQSVRHDGYYTDGTGDEDGASVRVQLASHPSESIRLNLGVDYSQQGGRGAGATVVGLPFEDRVGLSDPRAQARYRSSLSFLAGNTMPAVQNDGFNDNTFYGAYFQADIDTPLGALTILPAIRRNELDFRNTSSGFLIRQRETDDQRSLEVRLASDNDRPLRYLLGAYYFDEETDTRVAYNQAFFGAYSHFKTDTQSSALFGRLTWAATDRLRFTVGARSTRDEKSAHLDAYNSIVICPTALLPPPAGPRFCFGGPSVPDSLTPPSILFAPNGALLPVIPFGTTGNILSTTRTNIRPSKDFSKMTYRGAVEFDLGPTSLLYASVETGFKAGGFFASVDNPSYAPETITAYTVGSKNRLFGNRLQLNVELFYWKYKDQQFSHFRVNSLNGNEFVTENIGESSYRGVDVDAQFLATENTLLTANVQYLDAENESFIYRNPAGLGAPVTGCPSTLDAPRAQFIVNCSGRRPVKAPEWTATFGLQQTVPLGDTGKLIFDVHANYQSDIMNGQDYLPLQVQESYWLADLQATYTDAEERYAISAFVNNVSDEAVAGNIQVNPRASTLFTATLRPPRTYGLRVSGKF
jgi:iron complex outermembrane recepter protein